VAPFAYPDKPGYLAPDAATTHVLARPEQDVADALARPADELGVRLTSPRRSTSASTCRRKPWRGRRRDRRLEAIARVRHRLVLAGGHFVCGLTTA
jgi:hypothetical protein